MILTVDEILDIVQQVSDLQPYVSPFNDYTKGWYEACRCMSSLLEEKEKGL